MTNELEQTKPQVDEASDAIFTIPNMISFARMCLIPVFLVLLTDGHNGLAAFTFAFAAATDFVDGQIARRMHCVSKLGQLLDPAVDRFLMISGVVGLMMVDRLPAWIVFLVVFRDLFLIVGGFHLLSRWKIRIPVIFPGKVATTLLFTGFAGLLLNFPQIPGLGIVPFHWLPGFTSESTSWGIWFVYAGLILTVFTTSYYVGRALYLQKRAEAAEKAMLAAAEESEEGLQAEPAEAQEADNFGNSADQDAGRVAGDGKPDAFVDFMSVVEEIPFDELNKGRER